MRENLRWDSNPQPPSLIQAALPTELQDSAIRSGEFGVSQAEPTDRITAINQYLDTFAYAISSSVD